MLQARHGLVPDSGVKVEESARRALCAAYRNLHFSSPTSPRDSRRSESSEGARVKTDEEWTTRLQRGTTTAPPQLYHPNSVQSDDGSPLTGLECLQADLCRALGPLSTRPSALPDSLL